MIGKLVQSKPAKHAATMPPANPFKDALHALRAVSLRLQHIDKQTQRDEAYSCPLIQDGRFSSEFQATLKSIDKLDAEITRKDTDAASQALDRVDPAVRAAARSEWLAQYGPGPMLYTVQKQPGPKGRARDEAQYKAKEEILAEMGVPKLRAHREEIVDGIYRHHAETLEAIESYMPTGTETPITRRQARDVGITPGEEYSLRVTAPVDELRRRVENLSKAIRTGEDRYRLSEAGLDHAPAGGKAALHTPGCKRSQCKVLNSDRGFEKAAKDAEKVPPDRREINRWIDAEEKEGKEHPFWPLRKGKAANHCCYLVWLEKHGV